MNQDRNDDQKMDLGQHLEELRWRIILGLAGPAIGMIIMLIIGRDVVTFLAKPLSWAQSQVGITSGLNYANPVDPFMIYLKICVFGGLIIGLPWLIWQMWKFIETGLYQREKKFVKLLIPLSTCLTFLGVAFMYYIVLPLSLQFFVIFAQGYGQTESDNRFFDFLNNPIQWLSNDTPTHTDTNIDIDTGITATITQTPPPSLPLQWRGQLTTIPDNPRNGDIWLKLPEQRIYIYDAGKPVAIFATGEKQHRMMMTPLILANRYINFVLWLALAFAIAFQMPVIMLGLATTNILTHAQMRSVRKYVYFACIVIGALLTPADIVSQVLLAVPMMVLYEIGLVSVRIIHRTPA